MTKRGRCGFRYKPRDHTWRIKVSWKQWN